MSGRRKRRRIHPADAVDSEALSQATTFIATLFLGQGRYEKRETLTLEAAQTAAKDLATLHQSGRKALIYAILPTGRQILVI